MNGSAIRCWSSTIVQYNASLRALTHNQRKSGFTWKRTWTDKAISVEQTGGFAQAISQIIPVDRFASRIELVESTIINIPRFEVLFSGVLIQMFF